MKKQEFKERTGFMHVSRRRSGANRGNVSLKTRRRVREPFYTYGREIEKDRAEIRCYPCNANVFSDTVNIYSIDWDGMEFDDEEDWNSWADDVLSPIRECSNFKDVKMSLYIFTNHLIKD